MATAFTCESDPVALAYGLSTIWSVAGGGRSTLGTMTRRGANRKVSMVSLTAAACLWRRHDSSRPRGRGSAVKDAIPQQIARPQRHWRGLPKRPRPRSRRFGMRPTGSWDSTLMVRKALLRPAIAWGGWLH